MPGLPSATPSRTVLFLQGPPTPFWRELQRRFEAAGARTLRVNLCAGDWLLAGGRGLSYRGRFTEWDSFLDALVRRHGVTDILYYADCHPYHRVAAAVAARAGIPAIAVEYGYLRPDWLTLERGGMGARSHFPKDPDAIRAIAAAASEPDMTVRYRHAFLVEAVCEVAYHLSTYLLTPAFRHYRADRYYNPVIEYLSWLKKFWGERQAARHAEAVVRACLSGTQPYVVSALQLQSDYQIRANSPYASLDAMIDEVIASFARHARPELRLVFKLHPLENGMEDWPATVARHAARHGVGPRVTLMDGGDLKALLAHARGCVLINSTVGLHAIRAGCPTKVLGIAVFDIPGLTHQGSLDGFWTRPEPVDPVLAAALVRALGATIQVKGSFYDPAGRRVAASEIVRRVLERSVNEPGAFVDPPPRLARARALGLPIGAG